MEKKRIYKGEKLIWYLAFCGKYNDQFYSTLHCSIFLVENILLLIQEKEKSQ